MKQIFSKKTLREFWEKHIETEQYLKTWYNTVKSSDWSTPNEVKNTYANASILQNGRIVFNIGCSIGHQKFVGFFLFYLGGFGR